MQIKRKKRIKSGEGAKSEQEAERFALSPREFRRYAADHSLPKRKNSNRVYYTPEVIEAAAEERVAKKAAKSALLLKEAAAHREEVATASIIPVPLVNKQDLLLQALTAAQAQTALVDRIVQNIGRMG